MKAWAVSDKWYEVQVAVIAETRGRAKVLAIREMYAEEWIDLRCRQAKSPIPIEGPERVLTVPTSLEFGFRWNNETMDDYYPGWYGCWLQEVAS